MQMPTITQYADAIAEPAGLARTLGEFRVQRDNYGEVRIRTGNNASVFRVESRGRDMMLKCYVRSRTDLPFIYDYIAASGDELFPPMELMPGELYVFDPFGKGMYFDILAGDWIEGHTLDTEIKRACRDKDGKRMEFLSRAFDALALELLARPWAHGDLKPENIIVTPAGKLRLVDFDALYFPDNPVPSHLEMGTPGFQHPGREAGLYDKCIDDYPAALISVSLAVLSIDTSLYGEFNRSDIIIFHPSEILEGKSTAYQKAKRLLADSGRFGHYRLAGLLRSPAPALEGIAGVFDRICNPPLIGGTPGVFIENGMSGFRDVDSETIVLEPVFDQATPFREGASLVSVDGRPRLITYDGKFLLAGLEYDELKPLSDGWAAFSRQGKWGYADIHGNIVVEPRFDAAGNMHDGFAPVCLNGKWGYIDSSGECVTGFEYDRAMGVRNGVAIVYKGGKMVEMSIKNKIKR